MTRRRCAHLRMRKLQEEVVEEKDIKQSSLSWNYHKKVSTAGNSPVACPKCNLHKCPLAIRSSARCDVCDEPSAARCIHLLTHNHLQQSYRLCRFYGRRCRHIPVPALTHTESNPTASTASLDAVAADIPLAPHSH